MRPTIRLRSLVVISFLLLGTLSSTTLADTVWKKNGEKVVGKILKQEPRRVQIEVRQGAITAKYWIKRSDIVELTLGLTPEEEFEDRLRKLDGVDIKGHEALVLWAKKNRLRKQARALEKRLPLIRMRRLKIDNPKSWCRKCDATGDEKCVKCVGSGKLLVPCERCEGTGGIPCKTCGQKDSSLLRCRRCAGNGEYERFDPKKGRKVRTKCDDCKGTGTHECPTCDGKREQACAHCKGEKGTKHICHVCKGTPSRTCTTCVGSGRQPIPVSDEILEAERKAAEAKAIEEAAKKAKSDAEKPPGGDKEEGATEKGR